jgi:hypothetical protein
MDVIYFKILDNGNPYYSKMSKQQSICTDFFYTFDWDGSRRVVTSGFSPKVPKWSSDSFPNDVSNVCEFADVFKF